MQVVSFYMYIVTNSEAENTELKSILKIYFENACLQVLILTVDRLLTSIK